MGWSKVKDVNNKAPDVKGETVFKGFAGGVDTAVTCFFAVIPLHPLQFAEPQFFKFMGCIHMGNHLHALIYPISVAKVCMSLPIFIYDKHDGLIRDGLDFIMQRFGQNICSPGVDHNRPFSCYDEGKIIVMA